MSIQTVIDRAQSIEIDKRRTTAQSVSRSQRLKTAERVGAQPWNFVVTPPGSLSWSGNRAAIEQIDSAGRTDETEISLANNPKMAYITEYQGDLNSTQQTNLLITATTTASFTVWNLPAVGATIDSRSETFTAQSFPVEVSTTYARSFDTARTDFLITNTEYDSKFYKLQVGDRLTTSTYLTSNQTVNSITRNYITVSSTPYTRVVMSAAPNASSALNTPIQFTSTASTLVSTTTNIFVAGDLIQPNNSRYPYAVKNTVARGSGSTVSVNLHRPVITSEGITLTGQALKIGEDVTFRMVVIEMPTYRVIPYDRIQFTGDFRLLEKVI